MAGSISAGRVPDMSKRELMNLLLLGAISLPTFGMLVPYGSFLVPAGSGSNAGGVAAKDKLGNDILVEDWLKTHGPNDRTLAQGLKVCSTFGRFRRPCMQSYMQAEMKLMDQPRAR